MTGVNPKGGIKCTPRDPAWKWRRALGHKVVRSRKVYTRKAKHRAAVCVLVALLVAPVSADAGLKLVCRGCHNFELAMQKYFKRRPKPAPKLSTQVGTNRICFGETLCLATRSRVAREKVIVASPDVQRFTAIIQRYRSIQYDVSTYR